jgi:hypothetical protein
VCLAAEATTDRQRADDRRISMDYTRGLPASSVSVLLEGGPAHFLDTYRRCRAATAEDTIKIPCLGGYEHFERTGEIVEDDDERLHVYRWTAFTRIAE